MILFWAPKGVFSRSTMHEGCIYTKGDHMDFTKNIFEWATDIIQLTKYRREAPIPIKEEHITQYFVDVPHVVPVDLRRVISKQ